MAAPHRWDDLQAFLAVARSGRLTTAARLLGVEHTTLSRRLARLEASLGVRLFDRRPTGYGLTPEGQVLLPKAEEAEAAAERVWSGELGTGKSVAGTVRVGTPEAFGTFCLAGRLGGLAAAHPDLTVELVAMPRSFSLSKREADLAVGLSRPPTGRLHAQRLTDYELGLYGSADYLGGTGTPASLEDLKGHQLIGYIDELVFAPELDYFPTALPGQEPTIKISNVVTQMAAVAGGAGLCILPCFMAGRQPDLVRVLSAEVSVTRTYWLLFHSDMRDLRRIRLAADFVRQCVREDQRLFVPAGHSDASAGVLR